MSIIFHANTKEFHLTNGQVSYIMEIMENGQIGNSIMEKRCGIEILFSIYMKRKCVL